MLGADTSIRLDQVNILLAPLWRSSESSSRRAPPTIAAASTTANSHRGQSRDGVAFTARREHGAYGPMAQGPLYNPWSFAG